MIDCARKTVQWEGLGGLYKGVTSPLAGQMLFRASLFSSYGWAKRWLATNSDGTTRPLTDRDYYIAGAITGALIATTESPIDFYKSQLQVQIIRSKTVPGYTAPFTTLSGCIREVYRTNGLMGSFQGFTATFIRNTPANCVYLGNFELFKKQYVESVGPLTAPATILCGGMAGLTYWLLCYPVDVIKSAMMTDSLNKADRK